MVREEDFEPLPQDQRTFWLERLGRPAFSRLLGMQAEEVRVDYCRMRLPYRPELEQPMGVVHGGAIASLIDSVVVGAVFSRLEEIPRRLATVDLHVHYLAPLVKQDAIAEAWIRRRGRNIVFLAAQVCDGEGTVVAHGELSYLCST